MAGEWDMVTARSADETRIRQRIDALADAIRAEDLEGVMSAYAHDIVSFDVEPPLQHVGAEAKRQNWAKVFSMYQPPLDYEIRELAIDAGGDVAFGHGLIRIAGTLRTAAERNAGFDRRRAFGRSLAPG